MPHNLPFYAIRNMTETRSMAASTTYMVRLCGIRDWINQLFLVIRETGNVSIAQFSFLGDYIDT